MPTTAQAAFDIAVGVHEKSLNSFASAHHKALYSPTDPSVYRGEGAAKDLGIEKWSYDIKKAADFDLEPLTSAQLKTSRRFLLAQPEFYGLSNKDRREITRLYDLAPNAKIRLPSVALHVRFDQSSGNPPPPPIDVGFSLTLWVHLSLDVDGRITVTPTNAEISDETKFHAALEKALKNAGWPTGAKISVGPQQVCYPIERLIRHVIQALLRSRLDTFVINLPLPSAIQLVPGLSLTNFDLLVQDDFLITVGYTQASVIAMQSSKGASPGPGSRVSVPTPTDRTIFALFSQRVFQQVADRTMPTEKREEKSDRDGRIEWAYWWWYKLANPRLSLIAKNGRIGVNADVDGGGGAKARLHGHCGPTPWVQTDLRGNVVPNAYAELEGDQGRRSVALKLRTKPTRFNFEPVNQWDILGHILSWILEVAGTVVTNILLIGYDNLQIAVLMIPPKFPGTDLDFELNAPRFSVVNDDYWSYAARLEFKS